MQAIVLAGGFGTRLSSVISNVPKPMAPIQEKPFLEYLLAYLCRQRINKVILAVGYKYQMIQDYFGEQYENMLIKYSIEEEPLGTGGAVKKAFEMISENQVFIINGDTFFDVNLNQLLNNHLHTNADLTLSIKPMKNCERYGTVLLDKNRITGFEEKKHRIYGNINGGIYVSSKDLFKKVNMPQKFSFEKDLMEKHIDFLQLRGYLSDTYFIDIGIPEDYYKAQKELPTLIDKGREKNE